MVLDLLLRWGHILPAIILGGGLVMLGFAWVPAIQRRGEDLEQAIRVWSPAWPRIVAGCTLLLLVTGLVNFLRKIREPSIDSSYHMIFGIKFLLGLVLFFLAAVLTGRTGLAQRMRAKGRLWFPLAAILALVLALIGGWMRAMTM
jgi:hypothetical protein